MQVYFQMRTEWQLEGRRQHNRIQPLLQNPQSFVFAVAEHHCLCNGLQAAHDEQLVTNLNTVCSTVAKIGLINMTQKDYQNRINE